MSDNAYSIRTIDLKRLYDLHGAQFYDGYLPNLADPALVGLGFLTRIEDWLSCFTDKHDRWNAFQSLQYFLFLGSVEMKELYRCAVNHRMLPWLADQANIDIFAADADARLAHEIGCCWPCPMTDSLEINSLLKTTGLVGRKIRPDFNSLNELQVTRQQVDEWRSKEIQEQKPPVKYLVLFEDFSGSGRQCVKLVKKALRIFDGPILAVPLVICEPGDQAMRDLAAKNPKSLAYEPIAVVPANCLVRESPATGEPPSFAKLRGAMTRGFATIGKRISGNEYGFERVGALVVAEKNCPNNVPPIFHAKSSTWPHPLFRRHGRI